MRADIYLDPNLTPNQSAHHRFIECDGITGNIPQGNVFGCELLWWRGMSLMGICSVRREVFLLMMTYEWENVESFRSERISRKSFSPHHESRRYPRRANNNSTPANASFNSFCTASGCHWIFLAVCWWNYFFLLGNQKGRKIAPKIAFAFLLNFCEFCFASSSYGFELEPWIKDQRFYQFSLALNGWMSDSGCCLFMLIYVLLSSCIWRFS